MQKNYCYSAKENAFYAKELLDDYKSAGTLPDDVKDVSDSIFQEFATYSAPDGKVRAAGKSGLPCWVDAPKQTSDELNSIATARKSALMDEVNKSIAPLQDALDWGKATPEEVEKLQELKEYRLDLSRVDVTKPEWPPVPQQ